MGPQVSVLASANIPDIKAIGDFDTVAVTLRFPSGTLGMIDLSRNSSFGYDQRLEVFGPNGMIQADNECPNRVRCQYDYGRPTSAPIWYSFASRFMTAYQCEFEHFIDIVQGKAESLVKSNEILAVSKIAMACEEAARTGNSVDLHWAPEELPEDDQRYFVEEVAT